MSAATIIQSRRFKDRNRYTYEGVASFPTTDLTCTLPVVGLTKIRRIVVSSLGAPSTTNTAYLQTSPGLVSASAKFNQIATMAGSISAIDFTVSTTVATDATNIWTVGVLNKTATLTPADIADATNSNTTTTGAVFTAATPRALTLGVAAQLVVAVGDVLEWTFTKASSAANLVGLLLRTSVAETGAFARETVYAPLPNSSGFFDITSGAITIGRKATNATSALKFQFKIESW